MDRNNNNKKQKQMQDLGKFIKGITKLGAFCLG